LLAILASHTDCFKLLILAILCKNPSDEYLDTTGVPMRYSDAADRCDQERQSAADRPLGKWTRADVEQSIVARFEEQAARHGDRLAVRGERQVLTYSELDRLANRIARVVGRCAGTAATGVALFLTHDAMVPAAILGVLKAGRFYVPLEPGHPVERNALILDDCGAEIILTDEGNLAAARELSARAARPLSVVNVEEADARDASGPGVTASPHDICFIMYTSASTGRPKGVCQLHRNILHGTAWYSTQADLGPDDRMSLLHSLSAVAGATAIYGALLNGAAIFPFSVRKAGLSGLADWLEHERITCFHAVPTLFRRLGWHLEEGRRFHDVRLVRLGGEAISRTEWLVWREHFPDHCRLLVGLGSTEALNFRQTVYDRKVEPGGEVLPVGDPVPDKEVLLVDAEGNPVHDGETGEIVVRSEYLFAGYWKHPELNERVLRADPVDARRRLFRTGDLGRHTADGRLFHVGRVDTQVKVEGHRVEIAEVEQALRRVVPIHDAAVVARKLGPHSVRRAVGNSEHRCGKSFPIT
jgi:amino acid adenylation domain-containing protein